METKIEMSRKQLKQSHVLRNFNERIIDRKTAAGALGLSERQITRLAKGMKESGELALIHKNTNRKPAHTLQPEIASEILRIYRTNEYAGCNINHFKELLEREHGIKISYTPLFRLLTDNGLKSPKKHNKIKKHRKRKRKKSAGEMLQIDASPFDWLGAGNHTSLHGAIDDATGQLTGLYLTENECLYGYLEIMNQTILTFGVPLSIYSDKHTIFRSPITEQKEADGEEPSLTQFGRAMSELGINMIYANTPQAKGRIERVWNTLQSRLPVELKIRGINSIESANSFFTEIYITMFNDQFSVTADSEPIFIPYTHKEDINNILCIKEHRKTDSVGSFSYHNRTFKILDDGYPLIPSKAQIEVLVSVHGSLRVKYKNRIFKTIVYEKPEKIKPPPKRNSKSPPDFETCVKPHLVHGSDEWKKIWHYEDYNESLEFIYELFLEKYA